MSSPPSLRMAHSAPAAVRQQNWAATSTTMPLGCAGRRFPALWPVSSRRARPRSPQRGAGAGGVAAAQQFLPAADVMFKPGLGLRFAKQVPVQVHCSWPKRRSPWSGGTVFFRANASFGRKHTGNALRRNADDRVGQLLRQLQLVQGHDDGHLFSVPAGAKRPAAQPCL